MLKMILLPLAMSITMLFTGCASKATMENMAYKPTTSQQYSPNLKGAITTGNMAGGHETNPLWTSQIGNSEFNGAVKSSLVGEGLYSENGRYKLNINITHVSEPLFGLDFEVKMYVTYTLIDSITNKELLNKNITSSYIATVSDSFVAIKRLRLANEGSGKENIKLLLEELSRLKIDSSDVSISK